MLPNDSSLPGQLMQSCKTCQSIKSLIYRAWGSTSNRRHRGIMDPLLGVTSIVKGYFLRSDRLRNKRKKISELSATKGHIRYVLRPDMDAEGFETCSAHTVSGTARPVRANRVPAYYHYCELYASKNVYLHTRITNDKFVRNHL